MTKVGLYAIGKSTTLESNKSLRKIKCQLTKVMADCHEVLFILTVSQNLRILLANSNQ